MANIEALSDLSSTAGVDLVALRRKYLTVKENIEAVKITETQGNGKEEIDRCIKILTWWFIYTWKHFIVLFLFLSYKASALDDYVICKSCLGKGTVKSLYNKCIVVERECEECDGNSIVMRNTVSIAMKKI